MAANGLDTMDALMARYAAGNLPVPARVLIEAHLEMSTAHRTTVETFEAVAGTVVETIDPVNLQAREQTLKAVFAAPAPQMHVTISRPVVDSLGMPQALRDFVGYELGDIPWKRRLPGMKEHVAWKTDGCEATFFWIRPGRAVPEHTHRGVELSLVLHGAFSDGHGRFARGDLSVADDAIDHRPIAEGTEPCIVFAVTDAPLKLTGSFRQRLGDLLG